MPQIRHLPWDLPRGSEYVLLVHPEWFHCVFLFPCFFFNELFNGCKGNTDHWFNSKLLGTMEKAPWGTPMLRGKIVAKMVTCFAPTVTNRYPKPGPQRMSLVASTFRAQNFLWRLLFWIPPCFQNPIFFLFLYNMVTFHWTIWWVYWHIVERERETHFASNNSDSDCIIASFSSPLAKELIIWKIARKNTYTVFKQCIFEMFAKGQGIIWEIAAIGCSLIFVALNVHKVPANTKYSALTKHNGNCGYICSYINKGLSLKVSHKQLWHDAAWLYSFWFDGWGP